MKKILITIFSVATLVACQEPGGPVNIVEAEDYRAVLSTQAVYAEKLSSVDGDIVFWEDKLQKERKGFLYLQKLGELYRRRFDLTGDVESLLRAEDCWSNALEMSPQDGGPLLCGLASIAITQHQFSSAHGYSSQALDNGSEDFLAGLVHFDALIELGQYGQAKRTLALLEPKDAFGYLVRKARLLDIEGDLDGAIELMEKAAQKVPSHQTSIYCWAWSNLADYYGHRGEVKRSYANYLKVLNADPTYLYALRGIAWIAYAHDLNTDVAREILSHILEVKPHSPDVFLMMAELAQFEDRDSEAAAWTQRFTQEVSKPSTHAMYAKYLIDLHLAQDLDYAMRLAQDQVKERPTFETYSWLVNCLLEQGEVEKAHEIIATDVLPWDEEPEVQAILGKAFAASGEQKKAWHYLSKALESNYELGPLMADEIRELMRDL